MVMKICCGAFAVLCLSGCSGLEFSEGYNPKGLTYWEPRPYLFVSVTKDCVWTATPLSLPGGTKRSVSFHSGYGSAALSVTLTNGMITAVGQTTDTKVPETISAIGSLAGAAAKVLTAPTLPAGGPAPNGCKPAAILYEYNDGKLASPFVIQAPP